MTEFAEIFRELLGAVVDLTAYIRDREGKRGHLVYVDKQLANAKEFLGHPISAE